MTDIELMQHPAFKNSLHQLITERKCIAEFNKKISVYDYKFRSIIKPGNTINIDRMIELKSKKIMQLKLF